MKYSILFLRTFAILIIVYASSIYTQMNFGHSWQENFYHLRYFGYIGVDMFFIISGFVIALGAHNNAGLEDGIGFLVRRFVRTVPVYYLATMIYLVVFLLRAWIQNSSIDILFVVNGLSDMLLMFPAFSHQDSFMPLLQAGWTLGFVWFFYIMFFCCILFKVKRKILFLSLFIIVLVSIGSLTGPSGLFAKFITNPIMLEFLMGMLLCQAYSSRKKITVIVPIIFLIVGLGMYGYMVIYGFGNVWNHNLVINGQSVFTRVWIWGCPSALIIFGCVFLEKQGRLRQIWENKLVQLLGRASYSICLVHLIVLALFSILYEKSGFFLPADLSVFVHVGVSLIAGCLFHLKIEKRMISSLRKRIFSNISISVKPSPVVKAESI